MSIIAGVGDEVVEVVCLLVAAAVALLAWWSTAARPDRFRTVIVMERTEHSPPINLTLLGSDAEAEASAGATGSSESGSETEEAAPAGSAQVQEMDRIVDAMDADINVLRHRRLNFFTRTNGESTIEASTVESSRSSAHSRLTTEEDSKPKQCDINNTHDSEKIHINTTSCKDSEAESHRATSDIVPPEVVHKVNIKLKYLNDTFREVDGNLEEMLKDFKWRHFPRELSGNCRILLIYNGHVLSEDSTTLRACGLHHNSVVHCLVHPPRSQRGVGSGAGEVVPALLETGVAAETDSAAESNPTAGSEGSAPAEQRSWDLENVLMTLVSIVLTIIWFFRCEYSNMFTASASGALFALTIFYSIAIFGLYFSDTFQLAERRAPAPPPAAPLDNPAYA